MNPTDPHQPQKYLPRSDCPKCGVSLDGSTPAFHVRVDPVEGDFSICAYCGNIAVYRADQTLRPVTATDLANLTSEERASLERAQSVMEAYREYRSEVRQ